jgi:hypothetical protein
VEVLVLEDSGDNKITIEEALKVVKSTSFCVETFGSERVLRGRFIISAIFRQGVAPGAPPTKRSPFTFEPEALF